MLPVFGDSDMAMLPCGIASPCPSKRELHAVLFDPDYLSSVLLGPLSGVSTPVGDDLIDALAGSPDAVVSSGVLPGSAFTFLLDTMSGVRA
jgi:hypothetical protein